MNASGLVVMFVNDIDADIVSQVVVVVQLVCEGVVKYSVDGCRRIRSISLEELLAYWLLLLE